MVRVSSPIILVGLGAWVLGVLYFAVQPLPNIASTSEFSTKVFFPQGKADPSAACENIRERPRTIEGIDPYRETLDALIEGPSQLERTQEYFSNLPSTLKVLRFAINRDVAEIDVSNDISALTESSVCKFNGALMQLKETFKQFPKVKEVRISIEGLPASFLKSR